MKPTPIRTLQVILGALIAGLLSFTAVAVFVRTSIGGVGSGAPVDLLALVVLVLFAGMGGVYFMVRRSMLAAARAKRESALALVRQELVPIELQRLTLLGAALAEGPGLLGTVVVLIGGSWFLLAAPVIAMLCILFQMPSRERMEALLRESH
ncbi:MAG: hypothetical protein HZA53_16890 [Planctomycetes bacterium]|nr:hypothetical protein [Planctomycetota bacterium]